MDLKRSLRWRAFALAVLFGLGPAAPASPAPALHAFGQIDDRRLETLGDTSPDWLTDGRDMGSSYYSPLRAIDDHNVGQLGFAWAHALGTSRGLEASPVVVDGVMYAVGDWGRVYAVDARSGAEIWTFAPQIDGQWARYACCDVVMRGLAVWKGRVYVGATDGFLYALDAATGKEIWRADTLSAKDRAAHMPYTITGSPQIAGNVVVIGNGGADFGVRGYISAYDLGTGRQAWKFYTVPRNPALGPQLEPQLKKAIKTWDPKGSWVREGGGGTVWDGMAYDPALNLVYVGTGNASPYNIKQRSPRGGDNLYLASILAIHAESGELAWYYQEVPGECWDYDATQKFILTDLTIQGARRAVIMQASKEGFFYVLDRANGRLLAAWPFVPVNWTKGIDLRTGRPVPAKAADYTTGPKLIFPGMAGAHNWQPMSFDRKTGLVYIPAMYAPMVYIDTSGRSSAHDAGNLRRPAGLVEGTFEVVGVAPEDYDVAAMRSLYGNLPSLAQLSARAPAKPVTEGELIALDPLTGRIQWRRKGSYFWDGGVLSTAGNLVIQGDVTGRLNIYAADSGKLLRSIQTGTSIMAAPMTYKVGDTQYVAVMAGFGGGGGFSFPPDSAAYKYGNAGRILVFRLGGEVVPLPPPVELGPIPQPPALAGTTTQDIARGGILFNRYCSRCHVFGRGLLPDLRRMTPEVHEAFDDIVLRGIFAGNGMARFNDVLTAQDAKAIHAYITAQAAAAAEGQKAVTPPLHHQ